MSRRIAVTARQVFNTTRRFLGDRRAPVGTSVPLPRDLLPLGDELELDVQEWSVYRSVLRARFRVVERLTGISPRQALFLFGSQAVRVRLAPGPDQQVQIPLPFGHDGPNMGLAFVLADGIAVLEREPAERALRGDQSGQLFGRFIEEMVKMPRGRVLEIGSRARSGTVYRGIVPAHLAYTGLDIREGPNVDVVGDAHELEKSVGVAQFNVVYSIAVFEHLAMPWKAALSINRVLVDGGMFYAGTHQTFPLHETPWDFWRFSDRAWHSLFNAATGFEVLGAAMGEPADIVPRASKRQVWGIDDQPAFLTCGVLARKIGEPRVEWPVSISELNDAGFYPN
jgi:hypothetical protein